MQQFYPRYRPSVDSNSNHSKDLKHINPLSRKKTRHKETSTENIDPEHSTSLEKRSSDLASNGDEKNEALPVSKSTPTYSLEDQSQRRRPLKKLKTSHGKSNGSATSVLENSSAPLIEDNHKSIRAKAQEALKANQQALDNENHENIATEELERIQASELQPLPQPRRVKNGPRQTISALPEWLTDPIVARETASFDNLNLRHDIVQRLSLAGLTHTFAIQAAVLSRVLPGPKQHHGDICVSAFTGSGKTLAYTLPIIEDLNGKAVIQLRALIVVPTRELVLQVQEVFRITGSSLKVGVAVGSKHLKEERTMLIDTKETSNSEAYRRIYARSSEVSAAEKLAEISDQDNDDDHMPATGNIFQRDSKVDVLICTPGRLVDHIRSTKGFTLEHLRWLIIDEADRLLDQSFQEWIDVVMPRLERPVKCANDLASQPLHRLVLQSQRAVRKIILSATMTQDYGKLVGLNLQNPILITVEAKNQDVLDDTNPDNQNAKIGQISIPETLSEAAIAVKDAANKPLYLVQLIENNLNMPANPKRTEEPTASSTRNAIMRYAASSSEDDSDSETTISTSDSSNSDISSDVSDLEDDISSHEDTAMDDQLSDVSMADMAVNETESRVSSTSADSSSHGMLVFTNTNESAVRLCRLLVLLRPSWASRISPITKTVGTASGRKALAAFRKKRIDILVATDVASRGLDLDHLAHVVNYDLPKSATTYIHRVGRTARASRSGLASTLVAHHEARWFWNEIGKSPMIKRNEKVKREEIRLQLTETEQEAYESALERLGREAKGDVSAKK